MCVCVCVCVCVCNSEALSLSLSLSLSSSLSLSLSPSLSRQSLVCCGCWMTMMHRRTSGVPARVGLFFTYIRSLLIYIRCLLTLTRTSAWPSWDAFSDKALTQRHVRAYCGCSSISSVKTIKMKHRFLPPSLPLSLLPIPPPAPIAPHTFNASSGASSRRLSWCAKVWVQRCVILTKPTWRKPN